MTTGNGKPSNSNAPGRKILFVSHEATRTGAPMCLLHFLRWLRKNTDQEFEILMGRGGPLEAEFAKTGEVHKPPAFATNHELWKRFDLIYSNTVCNGMLLEQMPYGDLPIITHLHELDYGIDACGARNAAAVIKQTSHFIACARSVADRFQHRFRIPGERISVHYEMISRGQIEANVKSARPEEIRRKYKIPQDAFVLTGCGTFDLRKAPDLFVQTAAALRRDPAIKRPLRCFWIGRMNEVEPGRMLRHDVRRLGLQDEIQFLGELDSPHSLLALSDVFCMTSREDPFPLVMLEAAALGKPVICFDDTGGGAEFCGFGGGFSVPFLDVKGMADKCRDLLLDPAHRDEFGRQAAALVHQRFEVDHLAPQLWEKLNSWLAHPVSHSRYRTDDCSVETIFHDWVPEEAPEPVYVQTYLERQNVLRSARQLAANGRRDAAIKALIDSVQSVAESEDASAILESLLEIGHALKPLDPQRSAYLLQQAQTLARATGRQGRVQPAPLRTQASSSQETPRPTTSQPGHLTSLIRRANATVARAAERSLLPASVEPGKAPRKSEAPEASIVIPTFNNLALTRKCLEALRQTTLTIPCEVIIVDNASGDGTVEFLETEENAGRVRLVLNEDNLGFAHACNQGANLARAARVLFLNNDTVPQPGWLEAMISTAAAREVGVVGARLLYPNGTVQHAGIEFVNGVPDHPCRHEPGEAEPVMKRRELDMVTGACLLMPTALFRKLGGFDESYLNGVEDADLCLRVRSAGYKVVYEPAAAIEHLEGQSAGRFNHVRPNLERFFRRWQSRFDRHHRLVVGSPRIIRAEKTCVPEQKELTVDWIGSFLDHGSLSHVNRELTSAIGSAPGMKINRISNGTPAASGWGKLRQQLALKPDANAAVTVRHAWPPDWSRPKQGKLVVVQPWEFGALPEDWVRAAENADEFWVPSRYVRQVYVDSGVPADKVTVVPNGVDPDRFHPGAEPMELATSKKFKFLFVGGTIFRKGPDLLLKAYLENFTASDDVCLVIKDFGGRNVYAGQTFEEQIRAAQARPDAPEILYLNEELPPETLPGLYTACDCFVLPYRGEGFGLPVVEAMACGLPVIVTAGGATDDFVTDEFAHRIPAQRRVFGVEISGMKLVEPGWLLEPDLAALGRFMRAMFKDPETARERGLKASRHAHDHFSWDQAAAVALNRLWRIASTIGVPDSDGLRVTSSERGTPNPGSRPPSKSATRAAVTLPDCALVGHLGEARELLRQKKLPAAWAATTRAMEKRPFHPEGFLLLAEIALAAGAGGSARVCAEHVRRLTPRWKPVKQFLNKRLKGVAQPRWLVLPEETRNSKLETRNRLSVCLITKNEEQFLEQCLNSVHDVASQIVVVDTGSTDRTVEIAKQAGAEVHEFAWCDDFSAARNVALQHATGDWVLMVDADEQLDSDAQKVLREHMSNPAVMAWRLPIVEAGREQEGGSFVPRMFRNAPALFYVGRVHEQVFSSIEVRRAEWGLENRLGEARLSHHGYTAEMTRDRNKVARNLRLLEQAIQEMPGEPHLLMNLGLELARSGREAEALERYLEAFELLSVKPAAEVVPELRETLFSQLCTRLSAAKRFAEIVRVLTSPLACRGGLTASLHFSLGLAHLELRQFSEAADQMRQCLMKRHERGLCPINQDILTAAPQHCLALSLTQLGDTEAAESAFRNGMAENGHVNRLRLDYARFLAGQDRSVDALHCLHEAIASDAGDSAAWQLGGEIALSRPDFLEFARDWTGEAMAHLPDDRVLTRQRAETLLLSQEPQPAGALWELLCNSEPGPKTLAARIICDLLQSQDCHPPENNAEEIACSHAFLEWYKRLLAFRAQEVIEQLNSRIDQIRGVLPTAGRLLEAALAEAEGAEMSSAPSNAVPAGS